MGIAKGSWPAGSVFGKNTFYRETRGTRRGVRHVAKSSSDPRQDFAEFELQGRDLMRVVGIVAPFARLGAGIRGKFVLSNPRGEMDPGSMYQVPLAAVYHRRARQTSKS